MLMDRKLRGRVALLLGVLTPMLFLTPLAMAKAGAAPPTLTTAPQAITNAITHACTTGIYTEPSAPGVPSALVGKSVQVGGCSQFAPTSEVQSGSVSASSTISCTAGSGGFDNGYGTEETGYTLQNCSAGVSLLQAWNTDYFEFNGQTTWYTMCSDNLTQYTVAANDSFCNDSGVESGTYWKVRGRSEIILPAGFTWITVQPGCTGAGTGTQLCTAAAPGFTEYWNG